MGYAEDILFSNGAGRSLFTLLYPNSVGFICVTEKTDWRHILKLEFLGYVKKNTSKSSSC